MTPWPRRALQLGTLGLLVAIPATQIWSVGATTRWSDSELAWRYGPLAAGTVGTLQGSVGDPPAALTGALVGGTWSIRLGGLEIADPIALISLLTGGHLPAANFLLGAALVLAVHLLLGRFFCGYLCPYGFLSRQVSRLRRPLERLGLVHDWRPPAATRYVALALIAAAPLAGMSLAQLLLPYLALSRALHGLFFGGAAATAGLVAALLLSDLLLWEHGVCRAVCPSGALQRLLGRWRVLRLVPRKDRGCEKGCHLCASACWLGLDPRAGHMPPDCDGCGRCISSCPTHRLVLRRGSTSGRASVRALLWVIAPIAVGLYTAGCAKRHYPMEVLSTRSWSSPFESITDPGHDPRVRFTDTSSNGLALTAGTIETGPGHFGLRIYLEERPGEPWTGPLSAVISSRDGGTALHFDGPTSPRSVPEPVIYEADMAGRLPAELRFTDGPLAGYALSLERRSGAPWAPLAPALAVGGLWLLGFPLRRRGAAGTDSA